MKRWISLYKGADGKQFVGSHETSTAGEAGNRVAFKEIEIVEGEFPPKVDDGFGCAHCDYKTPRRNIVDLARHVNEVHPSETFLCGRRGAMSDHVMEGLPDCWEKQPNGDKVCLHCGSLSEADLFDIIEHYIAGDEGYRFETTDKGYKVYANRPGVTNASDGGIKFYGHHADKTHPDFQKRTALFERAVQVSHERFRASIARQRGEFKKAE